MADPRAAARNPARRPAPRRARPVPERSASAESLDRLIHERIRLGIVSALAGSESLTFNDLKALLATTAGNLSVHARKLEEGGYVACEKSFEGRLPKTTFRLTAVGRRALGRYLDHMEALIRTAKGASTAPERASGRRAADHGR